MKKLILPFVALLAYGANAQTYFSEDFNAGLTGWTATDVDADGENWYGADFSSYFPELEAGTAVSRSWTSTAGALTPNNYLTSGAIDLSTATAANLTMTFSAGTIEGAPFHAEEYNVYVTTAADVPTISAATPVFNEVLPSDGMFARTVDMSAYAGQTVYLTFRHFNTNDMNTLLIDNISIKNVLGNDASLAGVSIDRWALTNANTVLSAEVENVGGNAITSLEIDWNDGVSHVQTVSVNIAPGAVASVPHPDNVTYAGAVEANISVTISAVNGGADSDPSNNAGLAKHNTLSQAVNKAVVIEEGTGTWCGWCPRGAVAMDYMAATYPDDFIGIAVHNGDPMTVTAYDNGAGISSYPGANVDRSLLGVSVSQTLFESYYTDRVDMGAPANVGMIVTGAGANVEIQAVAEFFTPFANADYRLAVVISEDDVTGTTSGYNQANYYSGGTTVMGGYETLADPVPAADMVYDHVGRALLGGYAGQAGSVPATIALGEVATYTFNYTVPSTSNRDNMHAIVMLIDNATGEIVNAYETSINEQFNSIGETSSINMNVYPNPATDNVNVAFEAAGDYTITITDMAGRVVSTNAFSNLSGAQNIAIPVADLMSGNYIVSVATDATSYNQVLVVK